MDVGASTMFLWSFEEWEKLLEEYNISKNLFVLNAHYLEELSTSTIFDGFIGIDRGSR
jgi:hypothetical protein